MAQLPEDVAAALQAFEGALDRVETALAPMLALDHADFMATAAAADRARVEVTAAYALASLFYMYLKLQGVSPNEHPVRKEIERLALYLRKLSTHELLEVSSASAGNAERAKRIVQHVLFDVEEYQTASAATKGPKRALDADDDADDARAEAVHAPAPKAARGVSSHASTAHDDDGGEDDEGAGHDDEDRVRAHKKSLETKKPGVAVSAAKSAVATPAKRAPIGASGGVEADEDDDEEDGGDDGDAAAAASAVNSSGLTKAERRKLKKMRKRLSAGGTPVAPPTSAAAAITPHGTPKAVTLAAPKMTPAAPKVMTPKTTPAAAPKTTPAAAPKSAAPAVHKTPKGPR